MKELTYHRIIIVEHCCYRAAAAAATNQPSSSVWELNKVPPQVLSSLRCGGDRIASSPQHQRASCAVVGSVAGRSSSTAVKVVPPKSSWGVTRVKTRKFRLILLTTITSSSSPVFQWHWGENNCTCRRCCYFVRRLWNRNPSCWVVLPWNVMEKAAGATTKVVRKGESFFALFFPGMGWCEFSLTIPNAWEVQFTFVVSRFICALLLKESNVLSRDSLYHHSNFYLH